MDRNQSRAISPVIEEIWVELSSIFGYKWAANVGRVPSWIWVRELEELTPAELQAGLLACANWEGEWPPDLPQFKALCRPRIDPAHQLRAPRQPKSTEDNEHSKAIAALTISEIRKRLRS